MITEPLTMWSSVRLTAVSYQQSNRAAMTRMPQQTPESATAIPRPMTSGNASRLPLATARSGFMPAKTADPTGILLLLRMFVAAIDIATLTGL